MAIMQTDQWLRRYVAEKKYSLVDQCEILCAPLLSYFNGATEMEIHEHLLNHGLFLPRPNKEELELLEKKTIWTFLEKEYNALRNEWKGPDVPVFIFPSNQQNRSLKEDFNGKTGLSYKDKIFLFISPRNSKEELKALLTHEYNHTCRLNHFKNDSLSLLETIVLEGIAEKAVEERVGKHSLAPWTSIYQKDKAINLWNKYLKANTKLTATSPKFHQLLYGTKFYPKYLGYNLGYHITASYCENHPTTSSTLLKVATETILRGSDF